MYDTILLPLDGSQADRRIIEHVLALATRLGSKVVLLRVLTGPQAQFRGDEAGGAEVEACRSYLEEVRRGFEAAGVSAQADLAFGEPAAEIVRWIQRHGCDLVAMGTHGHRLLGDVILGFTASRVQHAVSVPVLLLRSK
jgi:nucleotide-binding universal stress UspA family protein